MKVRIDEERCIACGACEELCPDVFAVGDDSLAHVLVIDTEPYAAYVVEAAEDCPQGAILVNDE